MPYYLEQPKPTPSAVRQKTRDTVSEILLDVERDGAAAVRRWSERLDGWNPPSFRVSDDEIARAGAELDEELKCHIAFA
jgi:sulfopropanediol 3-dehydrogenase